MQLTHLLFGDDTLVFCSDLRDQLAYLNWILLWFKAISALKINLDKSSILPVRDVENLEALVADVRSPPRGLPAGGAHRHPLGP